MFAIHPLLFLGRLAIQLRHQVNLRYVMR